MSVSEFEPIVHISVQREIVSDAFGKKGMLYPGIKYKIMAV